MADLAPLTTKDEIITMAAAEADVTKVIMERCYNALKEAYKSVANQKDFQRFNILDLVMAEERQDKGTTPKGLGKGGGKKYSVHAFSFRQSDELSRAAND